MKKRTAFICSIISLLSLRQPLIIKSSFIFSTTGLMLSVSENVYAKDTSFYFDRAYENAEKGNHLEAIADYTKVIEINPENSDAYINRGLSKSELNDHIIILQ